MNIYSFEKLDVWKLSIKLAQQIYIETKSFPNFERFGIVDQLRRASVSISSNIAEGSSRSSNKEQARFYEIAYGSLMEVLNQLILSLNLKFISEETYVKFRITVEELSNKLNNLKKYQLSKHYQLNTKQLNKKQ